MPPPHSPVTRRRPRRRWLTIGATVALLALLVASAPVGAHGNRWGAAARGSATRFHVFITVFDKQQDGHCAQGRLHLGGRWRVRATDCSHSPVGNGVGSDAYAATGWISASACIDRHGYSSSTCHYGGFQAPFGSTNLGSVP